MTDRPKPESFRVRDHISQFLPHVKSGTLRIWGQWFGRPHDNIHRIVYSSADWENVIRIVFESQEALTVVNPSEWVIDESTFKIQSADRIVWEWHYYGKPRLPENLCRWDLRRDGAHIQWRVEGLMAHDLKPSMDFPAVEIH